MKLHKAILIFLSMLTLTLVTDSLLDSLHFHDADHKRLQEEMDRKFRQADKLYDRLQESNWQLGSLPDDPRMIFLAYRKDSLSFWSDNRVTFAPFEKKMLEGKRFEFISNGWYIIKSYENDSMRTYALILVKTQYPYENDFLTSRFEPGLRLPRSTELLVSPETGTFAVHDWEGIYLFSIRFSGNELRFSRLERYLTPTFYLITLLAFFLLARAILMLIRNRGARNIALLLLTLAVAFFRFLQYRFHFPHNIYTLEAFGPVPFGRSAWLPSLGDVFLNTILILFLVVQYNRDLVLKTWSPSGKEQERALPALVLIALLSGFYLYTRLIFSNLILHSTINLEPYKVASLNVYSIMGLLIAAMQFTSMLLITHRILAFLCERYTFRELSGYYVVLNLTVYLLLYLFHFRFDLISHAAFFLMFSAIAILHYRKIPINTHTALAIAVFLFSAYAVYFIAYYTHKRTLENMRVMAENLATQHDPVAEYLFEDISQRLEKDSVLTRYLYNYHLSYDHMAADRQIFNHLQTRYFNGFWGKYKLVFQVCDPGTVFLTNQTNCYSFYDEMIKGGSMKLPRSDFYYLDTQNGRINYLGWIKYGDEHSGNDVNLYLELESRLIAEELGYPELLLDKKYQKNKLLETYSYAKYYRNQLLAQSGSFQYSLNLNTYRNKASRFEGYNHLMYYLNKDSVVMVSVPTTSFFDKLVSFSYIFLLFYLILVVYLVTNNFSQLGRNLGFNFKSKIQLGIIAALFLSLILVGGGTIYFSIEQYQKKQHDLLSEKIQSVYVELDRQLAYLQRLRPGIRGSGYNNLNQLLTNFSDVFYTDINLYDPKGNLLATSRPEIFNQGMQGTKMNPVAYGKMVKEKQAEFIHREKIGNLSYLSAYVPFVNAENKLLAYLNLPYFTRQTVLRNDVTTLSVAIVNVYVILILLTIAMAAVISDQITRPLRLIQQKFSEIKLGKKNEEIVYAGRDEIAGLVGEYNRMVKELAKSMEMLARSERETAWREMAKQIAHEIKNPLTPMKLSVQHLLRSWNDKREDFGEYVEKVSRTLIEQIDNLSFIASEFSSFAKMPKAYNQEFDLIGSIRSTLLLFSNTENVDFIFHPDQDEVRVFADKEQLSQVFINLIKNAIQSIPENRPGRIEIHTVRNGDQVRILVSDNGKGIPEDVQSKLFTPSFTTKSSGMGLGLSIAKNIIESFGGHISFHTRVHHGTTFTIELPVVNGQVRG